MPRALATGCIHHPAVEAVAHCHQCSTPVCGACVVAGPTGKFCSFGCREKHEQFMKNAQDCDISRKPGGGFSRAVRKLAGYLVFLAALLFCLGILGAIYEVPVLSDLTRTVRGMIGF
jgi:hypothetical protein